MLDGVISLLDVIKSNILYNSILWHVRRCNIVCGNICVVYGLKYIRGLKIYLWIKKLIYLWTQKYICGLKNISVD